MVNKIGRLTDREEKELQQETIAALEIYKSNEKKGTKKIEELAACKNYFGREIVGKTAADSEEKDKLAGLMRKLLDYKIYTKRATALFFFLYYYKKQPEAMIEIVSNYYDSIKWEAENIMDLFWKDYPQLMKQNMLKWIESTDERKRSLSFHGLENISIKDPHFVMEFIIKIIDDESLEVQKKITHTLIQIARSRPAEVYPYVQELLKDADDRRVKTIWVSMKKLANSLKSSNTKDKNDDFVLLTKNTIKDWRSDKNKKVHIMGDKLFHIIKDI
jgi:3-methyladenine DNA glycosylase AlkC